MGFDVWKLGVAGLFELVLNDSVDDDGDLVVKRRSGGEE